MKEYENKSSLVEEINKRAKLFAAEFEDIEENQKHLIKDGVDRSPSQMIAYQLGWMGLILGWERAEKEGAAAAVPAEGYKWNNLGGLYASFYKAYENQSLKQLLNIFDTKVNEILEFVNTLAEEELFVPGSRRWASSTPSNWPVWKWVHINTVAPFTNFRTKIRKWKKS